MQAITTIGLDIAKSVFQVHAVDAKGNVVLRRQIKRRYVLAFFQKLPPCLVGIEACASAHHWSRQLQALGHAAEAAMRAVHSRPALQRPSFAACSELRSPYATSGCARGGAASARVTTRFFDLRDQGRLQIDPV
jgi:hypothetical protein